MDVLSLESLLGTEHAGWDSLCTGRGGEFYGELLTDDALMVLVNGLVLDRQQVIDSLRNAPAWDSYTLSDARLIPLGRDAAALVYRADARRANSEEFSALMTSVYRLTEGRPRLALYQQTSRPQT